MKKIKVFWKFCSFSDTLDVFFVVLCTVLAILVVLSTSYDFHLKRNNLPHLCNREHYKRPVDNSGCKLIFGLISTFRMFDTQKKIISFSTAILPKKISSFHTHILNIKFSYTCDTNYFRRSIILDTKFINICTKGYTNLFKLSCA